MIMSKEMCLPKITIMMEDGLKKSPNSKTMTFMPYILVNNIK